jgi:alkylation response protein AidB-like acyl-CoA dehydrogenase
VSMPLHASDTPSGVGRSIFEPPHDDFRRAVRQFISAEIAPNFDRWEAAGVVDRELFVRAGSFGLLGMAIPEELGGAGIDDFRYNVVFNEECHAAGTVGAGLSLLLEIDIVLPYFLEFTDAAQKARWLPSIATGEAVIALAITEPGAGSDVGNVRTSAVRDGDHYVVKGSKTFITNGMHADLVVVAVRTSEERARGLTLLVVERGMGGFSSGPQLEKIGLHSEDTTELFFDDVRVPLGNRLGMDGDGFGMLMRNLSQERLSIAVSAVASARRALDLAILYANERRVFGGALVELQNTKFRLAEMATEVEVGQAFVDQCVAALIDRKLSPVNAAMAKWWTTEMLQRVVNGSLQLHGGYGYMREFAIAKAYLDARVTTIYGGTTEIMKELIGRSFIARQHARATGA